MKFKCFADVNLKEVINSLILKMQSFTISKTSTPNKKLQNNPTAFITVDSGMKNIQ